MSFTVYILYSPSTGRTYTGLTDHLERRLHEHRSGKTKSIRFAKDWELMWRSQTDTREDARLLEKRIKQRGAKRYLADQQSSRG